MRRYEEAMRAPDTEPEARVRAAWFLQSRGRPEQALEVLRDAPGQSADLHVRYLAFLVRGEALRALGRSDDAVAAFRQALAIWPGAQSATVALMTLLVNRGERQEAAALARSAEGAAVDRYDPWWTYWLGDYRVYPSILGKLRELGR
jgi:tetratricopeptide (TPR) repeat protein